MARIRITHESIDRRRAEEAAARRAAWWLAVGRVAATPALLAAGVAAALATVADGDVAENLMLAALGTAAAALAGRWAAAFAVDWADATAEGVWRGFAAVTAGVVAALGGLALIAADSDRWVGVWLPPLPVAGFIAAAPWRRPQQAPAASPAATTVRPPTPRATRVPRPAVVTTARGVTTRSRGTGLCGGCLGPITAADSPRRCPLGHEAHPACAQRVLANRCPKCGRSFA